MDYKENISTHELNPLSKLRFHERAAAGYTDPHKEVDEYHNHRRMTDGMLHWQHRPKVYPFRDKSGKGKTSERSEKKESHVSMYVSEFIKKPLASLKVRPSSITRRNNPQPNVAFHVKHMFNQGVPVVRTRMTLEEYNRKPNDSPYVSNTHRVYRQYKNSEIDRARPARQMEEIVTGIVPELNKSHASLETRLFPVIPRNTRLTADRANELTNSVIKPKKNKTLSSMSRNSGQTFPYLSNSGKETHRPSLKPVQGSLDTLEVKSWDGAPLNTARTTTQVFGKKRRFPAKSESDEKAASTVVPELEAPTSKSLMFKEYAQYPKYAPQMIQEYYSARARRGVLRPYVY